MKRANAVIYRLAPCLVVVAVAALALGISRHDTIATVAALMSTLTGIFAWIGAS